MTTATEDTSTTEETASPASPEEVSVELALEDLPFETDEVSGEPTPTPEVPAAPPAATPTVPTPPAVAATPAPAPEKPKGNLTKAVQEERAKRRQANERAEFWHGKAVEIKRAAERTVENLTLRGRTKPRPIAVKSVLDDAKIREIEAKAAAASDMGVPIGEVLRTMKASFEEALRSTAQDVDRAFEEHEQKLEREFRQREIARSEATARKRFKDYDAQVARAGIYRAIEIDPATNTWVDPKIGNAIFVDGYDDPAEASYYLARALNGESLDTTDPAAPADPEPSAPAPAAPTPAPPAPVAAAPAARGTQPEAVPVAPTTTTPKPRGVRILPRSGDQPARVVLNDDFRRHLDDLMDRQPDKYLAFVKDHPEIDRWHMSG